jgi:rare lipoprotein A
MKRFVVLSLILAGIAVFSFAQSAGTESFRQEGIASWYGKEFEGRPTASGEIFNPGLFTAAHPTLPFGTILIVTNKHNMRQVTVKINDRGPFVSARIIDLSRAAAEVLDMVGTGTAPVVVERAINTTLGPVLAPGAAAPTPAATPAPTVASTPVTAPTTAPVVAEAPVQEFNAVAEADPKAVPDTEKPSPIATVYETIQDQLDTQQLSQAKAVEIVNVPFEPSQVFYPAPPAVIRGGVPSPESAKLYRLQVGAFKVPKNAVDVFDRLKNAGLNPAYEQNGEFYRVVLAGLKATEIQSIAQTLGNSGFREAILREEN